MKEIIDSYKPFRLISVRLCPVKGCNGKLIQDRKHSTVKNFPEKRFVCDTCGHSLRTLDI